jgi:hypothetical protein
MRLNYRLYNNLAGWLVFLVATATYVLTIEPTASFWDCGEYIACSNKLEVGHPPGAPFFLLIGRFFIWIGGDNPLTAAKWMNIMSALCSSFTILFLYWSITRFGVKIVNLAKHEFTFGRQLAVIFSGVVGALAYAFSDSFWFSAVEGEVYAMSSLFTAVAFWAILKWEEEADNPSSVRWLIFLAYLVGLSIGVHLLNLLVIPAVCFIFYFRKYKFTTGGFLLTGIISVVLLGGIQGLMIPKIVKFSADYELFFKNSLGMGFSTGTTVYFTLLLLSLFLGIMYSIKRTKNLFNAFIATVGLFTLLVLITGAAFNGVGSTLGRLIVLGGIVTGLVFLKNKPHVLHHILVSLTVLLMGYSTFFVLVIRSQANTPMDENNPENAISLLSYLNREQYGDWPILYGPYYNAPLDSSDRYEDGDPLYAKDTVLNKYVIVDDRQNSVPNYDKAYCSVLPRMWSEQRHHINFYERYRKTESAARPSFGENLSFLFQYQLNYMFWRYFGWNFIGRQNDIQGQSNNAFDGNVISGFASLDKKMTGTNCDRLPNDNKNNKANNKFYFLPLLLGLIGLFYHIKRSPKDFFVCFLLFFFTGIAIVIYLNQTPYQPRERDYAYAGAFYSFAIWIGLGVMGIFEVLNYFFRKTPSALLAGIALAIGAAVPYIMAKEGWDDHDRSGRFTTRDFAINYLQSCEKNAVLFTNGDNDTFPLWYVQEVEKIRTDVRVINLSLLQGDWYIDDVRRAAYDSPPVPFTLSPDKYAGSRRDAVYYKDTATGPQSVKELMDFIAMEGSENKMNYYGSSLYFFPTQNLRLPVDSQVVMKQPGLISPGMENRIPKEIAWTMKKDYLLKNDLMVLDLLAAFKWERPVYFAVTTDHQSLLGLEDYLQLEGLAWRLTPVKSTEEEKIGTARVNTEKMYINFMEKFRFGGIKNPGIYLDENTRGMAAGLRYQVTLLADALIQEKKYDKAEKVLNKLVAEMPENNIPYDGTMVRVAMSYNKLGKKEKAVTIANRLRQVFENDYEAYTCLPAGEQARFQKKIEQALGLLQVLEEIR